MANLFSADAFKKAQASSGGDFPEIDPGLYIATLISAKLNNAKTSGRLQISFDWQIDEDDDLYPNQHLWDHLGLTNGEGETNQTGYEIFCRRLKDLGVSSDEFLENNTKVLNSLSGTRCRVQVKKSGDFTNVWIDDLISSPNDGTTPDYDEDTFETHEDKDVNEESKLEISTGTSCIAGEKQGLVKFVDASAGKVLVEFPGGGQELYDAKDVSVITNEDTPKQEIKAGLAVGQYVQALFNGKDGEESILGLIHEITEDGKVKVLVKGSNGDGDKIYPCQKANVRAVA